MACNQLNCPVQTSDDRRLGHHCLGLSIWYLAAESEGKEIEIVSRFRGGYVARHTHLTPQQKLAKVRAGRAAIGNRWYLARPAQNAECLIESERGPDLTGGY